MKKTFLILLLGLASVFSAQSANIISVPRAKNVKTEVLAKITDLIDTMRMAEIMETKANFNRKIELLEKGDTAAASNIYVHYGDYEFPYGIIVVVNNLFGNSGKSSPGPGFSFHFMAESQFTDSFYGQTVWPKRSVNKYGYTYVRGFKVFLVELKNGVPFFDTDEQSDNESFELNYKPAIKKKPNELGPIIEPFSSFVYSFKNGRFKPLIQQWHVTVYLSGLIPLKED